MDPDLKKRIVAFCLTWGRLEAGNRLRAAGISKSMTEKLLSGNYNSQPDRYRLPALEKALGKK